MVSDTTANNIQQTICHESSFSVYAIDIGQFSILYLQLYIQFQFQWHWQAVLS